MAQAYLTKTLFKHLGRHIPKEALAGNKEAWTPDIMARAVSLIEKSYKLLSTIIRHLFRLKAFIDSLESDQVDGECSPEFKIDQTLLINALIKTDQAIEEKKVWSQNRIKAV